MKSMILTIFLFAAFESQAASLYRCQFISERPGKDPFVMTGHVVASDKEDITYLTLQPPMTTDLPYEARVLITEGESRGYNPMTIYPRGDTVQTKSRGELNGKSQSIDYVDSSGTKYSLGCVRQ